MTSTPASAGTWSCRGTTRSDHNSWRRREGCSKITCFLTCNYNYNGLDYSRFLYMLLFSAVTPGKTNAPKHASVSWLLSYSLQSKLNCFPHSLLLESYKYSSTNNSLEASNKLASICATSALTVTCETVSPEGHGEPHSHHHVGSATILRWEHRLKITPYLKE